MSIGQDSFVGLGAGRLAVSLLGAPSVEACRLCLSRPKAEVSRVSAVSRLWFRRTFAGGTRQTRCDVPQVGEGHA